MESKLQVKKMKNQKNSTGENPMREIKIEKVVLNIGGTGDYLNKGHKLDRKSVV